MAPIALRQKYTNIDISIKHAAMYNLTFTDDYLIWNGILVDSWDSNRIIINFISLDAVALLKLVICFNAKKNPNPPPPLHIFIFLQYKFLKNLQSYC